jgi:hypothetical protein
MAPDSQRGSGARHSARAYYRAGGTCGIAASELGFQFVPPMARRKAPLPKRLADERREEQRMAYTLTQLAADIRETLRSDGGRASKERICSYVSRSLTDKSFIAAHLKDRAPGAHPREVLYEDPELGFCICGHVYDGAANGTPHDHGPSWAIYGQATGITEMTDWRIVKKGSGGEPSLVEPVKTYRMNPGDAHLYDVGDVHSPKRSAPVRLIRIEGQNLDRVQRSPIKAT